MFFVFLNQGKYFTFIFWKTAFLDTEFLVDSVFFKTPEYFFPLTSSIVSAEKSSVNIIGVHCKWWDFHLLFSRFSSFFWLSAFLLWSLCVYPNWNLKYVSCLSVHLESFLPYFCEYFSAPFGCYNLSGVLVLWARCPTFLASSAYFSFFFSLSLSVCTTSLNVSSSLLILPSVCSNLPLGLSCEFLNFSYYTFNCRISIWFSFRISLSLLTFSLWQCQMMWLVIMPSFTSFIILSFNSLNVVIMSTLKSLPFKSFFGSLSQIVYVVCLFSGIRFILSCFFWISHSLLFLFLLLKIGHFR